MDREAERLPPFHDERLRERREGTEHPDYPNPYDPVREQQRAEHAATSRRLAREEAFANSGLVAGHDFRREEWERLHGHERER